MSIPPLATMVSPTTKRFRGEARNSATSAISSGGGATNGNLRDTLREPALTLRGLGGDGSRADRVDEDVVRRELLGHRFGKADHGCLGRRVVRQLDLRPIGVGRGDIDDPAIAARHHQVHQCPRREKDSFKIDLEGPIPIGDRNLAERAVSPAARIVDQNIETSLRIGLDPVAKRAEVSLGGRVGGRRMHVQAPARQCVGCTFESRALPVDHEHPRAALG
jgi:hypothetical protein